MDRFRTCLCYLLLLKLHAMYKPPLHLINFFYSQLTSLYCFSKRVFYMKSTAFFVYNRWVNIFPHSTTPDGSFCCLSFHFSRLKRVNFRHSIRTCQTVSKEWPHLYFSLATIFWLYKNEESLIFPVCICTSKKLCGFFSLV